MFDKFWEGIGTELAGMWKRHAFAPAFFFWAGGFTLWVWRFGFAPVQQTLTFTDAGLAAAWIGGILSLVIFSNALVNWLTFPCLRLLEGYWSDWTVFGKIKRWRIGRLTRRLPEKVKQLSELKKKMTVEGLTGEEANECIRLESELSFYPRDPAFRMPTRLGNILRAAEEYPYNLYGLEVATTWGRLWLALPEKAQEEVLAARRRVNERVGYIVWSVLFLVWVWVTPWALLVPLVVAPTVYFLGLLEAAKAYGQLLRVCYDLYRFEMYKGLHVALPVSFQDEDQLGKALTRMLKTGLLESSLRMEHGKEEKQS